jgi:hypothetical protein
MDHCGIEIHVSKESDGKFDWRVVLDLGDHHTGCDHGGGFATFEECVAAAVEASKEYLPQMMSYDDLAREYGL